MFQFVPSWLHVACGVLLMGTLSDNLHPKKNNLLLSFPIPISLDCTKYHHQQQRSDDAVYFFETSHPLCVCTFTPRNSTTAAG